MNNDFSHVPEKLMRLFTLYPDVTAEQLADVYAEHAVFEDPVTRIEGLDNISSYYRKMYRGVISCRFDFVDVIDCRQQASFNWIMTLRHRSIKRTRPINVSGCSLIRYDQKVVYHRDYFDMGEMLYANLPLLGPVIRLLRNRLH